MTSMDPFFGFWPKPGLPIQSDASLLTRGLVLLTLGTGNEAIVDQVGEIVTDLSVLGVGNYQLDLNPDAKITEPDRTYVFAQPYDLGSARTVTVDVSTFDQTIRVRCFLANGTSSSVARVALAIFYNPPPEPP